MSFCVVSGLLLTVCFHDLRPVVISIIISALCLFFFLVSVGPMFVLLHMKTAAGVQVRLC